MTKKNNKGMYARIQKSGGDPVGKGLLPPLFRLLASLSLLTTIIFIVWGWTNLSRKEGDRKDPNPIPIVSGLQRSPFSNTSQEMPNDIGKNELDSLFTERKESIKKSCQGIDEGRHNSETPPQPPAFSTLYGMKSRVPKHILSSTTGTNRRNWIFIKPRTGGKSIEWCPIYKAASSPWMAIFGKLTSILTPHTEEMIRAGKLTFIKLFKDFRLNVPAAAAAGGGPGTGSYKMLVVRHPFHRLLSAYRDKLERIQGRAFYYQKYGTRILAEFRFSKKSSGIEMRNQKGRSPDDTFRSMLSKVLELQNTVKILRENGTVSSASSQLEKRPTFYEFVQYLLSVDVRSMDEHWRPMYLDCNPCQYHFDLILKVETMERDRRVLFNLFGFGGPNGTNGQQMETEMNKIWNRWTNKGKPYNGKDKKGKIGGEDGESLPPGNYFSQVPKSDLKLLYQKYEMDFLLFNYSPTPYFLMGK